MIKIVLLGSGNVAYHLALALKSATSVQLVQRYRRNKKNDLYFDSSIPVTSNLSDLEEADIYIIAVKDEAIGDLSEKIKHLSGLVVHTSGSIHIDNLRSGERRGVFYPVQSLTINQKIDFKGVPLVIESVLKEDLNLLHTLAGKISSRVFELNSSEREKLHITAVFANNFSNYMFTCAEILCSEFKLPFEILKPIILETGKKIQSISPAKSQTGPARRNDQEILKKHMEMLSGDKREIYQLLSKAITKLYQTKETNNGKEL